MLAYSILSALAFIFFFFFAVCAWQYVFCLPLQVLSLWPVLMHSGLVC